MTDITTVYRELLRKQVSKKFYYGVVIRIPNNVEISTMLRETDSDSPRAGFAGCSLDAPAGARPQQLRISAPCQIKDLEAYLSVRTYFRNDIGGTLSTL